MFAKTLNIDKTKEKIHSLSSEFFKVNEYFILYHDDDSFIFNTLLNKGEFFISSNKLKIIIKPKFELLFIPFAVFLFTYVFCNSLFIAVCFAIISYSIFFYEQIVIYGGIKKQLFKV